MSGEKSKIDQTTNYLVLIFVESLDVGSFEYCTPPFHLLEDISLRGSWASRESGRENIIPIRDIKTKDTPIKINP